VRGNSKQFSYGFACLLLHLVRRRFTLVGSKDAKVNNCSFEDSQSRKDSCTDSESSYCAVQSLEGVSLGTHWQLASFLHTEYCALIFVSPK
jgi:hypothetical protein